MKHLFFSFVLFFCVINSRAQFKYAGGLRIGDTIPAISLKGFLADTNRIESLRSFQDGMLLLVDFWATWCVPCVDGLIKNDSLNKIYRGRVKILPVTYESVGTIKSFIRKSKILQSLSLDFLCADSVLHNAFPHYAIPHVVWVNGEGKVVAITAGNKVTATNIDKALANESLGLSPKIDILDHDFDKPFYVPDSAITYRSVFSKAPPGLGNRSQAKPTCIGSISCKFNRFLITGRSLIDIITSAAYNNSVDERNVNRFVLKVKDSLKIISPAMAPELANRRKITNEEWWENNTYSYEIILPEPVSDTVLFGYMMADLNRFLPYKAEMRMTTVKCLIISDPQKIGRMLKSKGSAPRYNAGQSGSEIHNHTMKDIVYWLNDRSRTYMILDETGIKHPIDLDLGFAPYNFFEQIDELRKALESNGLRLSLASRRIPLLYISDK